MPRGEHFRKVTDNQILEVFDRPEGERKLLSASDVASELPVTSDAVRQRMHRMDELETTELGGTTYWKKEGVKVFADGGYNVRGFRIGTKSILLLTRGNLDPRQRPLAVLNLNLTLLLVFIGLLSYSIQYLFSIESLAFVGFVATLGAFLGLIGELMLIYSRNDEPWDTIGKLTQKLWDTIGKLAQRVMK